MGFTAFDIGERVVVLTGGLGQLGKAYTKALYAAGAKVAVLDNALKEDTILEGSVLYWNVDVTDRDSIERALEQINKEWGVPHALINNAGVDSPPRMGGDRETFENYSIAEWHRVIDTNLMGSFLCCQVIGSQMASEGRGSIVNIGSLYGMVSPDQRMYSGGFVKPVAYSASKAGVLGLTHYLATYWAPQVRVNTLTLGGVFNHQEKGFLAAYQQRVPMGRMGNEDEFGGPLIFLISDASSYMTGANLVVDGGWTAW